MMVVCSAGSADTVPDATLDVTVDAPLATGVSGVCIVTVSVSLTGVCPPGMASGTAPVDDNNICAIPSSWGPIKLAMPSEITATTERPIKRPTIVRFFTRLPVTDFDEKPSDGRKTFSDLVLARP